MPKIDRLVLLEIVVGIILFGVALYSFLNTYQRFGQFVGFGFGESVPVVKIQEKWYSAFTQAFRAFILVFFSGLILMHGISSLLLSKGKMIFPEAPRENKFIEIIWRNSKVTKIELLQKLAPKTCETILNSLPFESEINLNKIESGIYFKTPAKIEPENQRLLVKAGDVGYSTVTESIYIFYGKAQSVLPLNIFAKVAKADLKIFQKMFKNEKIQLKKEK